MKVLVTGGSGFIGTNLVEYYLNKGVEVLNIDIVAPRNIDHWGYGIWRQVDIRDFGDLHAVFADFKPTHVVNLAAQTGTSDRGRTIRDYDTNYVSLMSLAEAAVATSSVERLVSASSMLVCRSGYKPKSDTDYCPPNLYGRSKVLGEKFLQKLKDLDLPFSWVVVRPTGVWGPWFEMPYKTLFSLVRRGLYVHPGGSHPIQSLGFVGNTVCQIDRLLHAPSEKVHGRVFYLADYPPTDMRAWAGLIQRNFKARRIPQVPVGLLNPVAVVGDIAKSVGWDVPLLSSSRLENMLMSFTVDLIPMLARGLPYTLGQATRKTVEWMKVHE